MSDSYLFPDICFDFIGVGLLNVTSFSKNRFDLVVGFFGLKIGNKLPVEVVGVVTDFKLSLDVLNT